MGVRLHYARWSATAALLASALLSAPAPAQTLSNLQPDWRHIGSTVVELALASPASGPADRVWYSADGLRLFVRTADGRVFETADFEKWQPSPAAPPAPEPAGPAARPEGGRGVRVSSSDPLRLYAWGGQVFRSDDGGGSWANMTALGRRSIIGGEVRDLAVSPLDAEDVVAVNNAGVWRSLDGGVSWAGLNESLPNLPARRIADLPRGSIGVRLEDAELGGLEWVPGEKQVWRTVDDAASARQSADRRALSATLAAEITAVAWSNDFAYAGSADGRLWVSADRGRSWTPSGAAERGAVEAIYVDPREPRLALAALARATRGGGGARVL
ncbi:MAG TPA: hypothetical protein VHA11_13485, partial [Bryobacteraceae bacterium]|nr:hypothetical protein [Bryobacteraceae bacterium]